ncbi:DUF5655 domain-containing protein [Methanocorpusculum sp. MG]|uniref:DUF5655 domain-containing protein n=1 Tax=Methanocorpusculum petauri TaxID=3002863 RepID=A0ABT4IDB0_9EURY|nr:DUF5655 domain-containing protein [Methanocorpusculum petauri]MCZ0859733.1 DUF5655 domain-containing protein [Methanocorpusculum petauri]
MPKIALYQTAPTVKELPARQTDIEKRLQILIEENMETFFGVRFLASEYTTRNGGRIDSLGLDENNLPVIFEYKRFISENVINQGLFYLDWLLDHKADFRELVRNKLGAEAVKEIDATSTRLICIASDFTKYDIHAVNQIDRSIDLIRYQLYDNDLILFEQAYTKAAKPANIAETPKPNTGKDKTFADRKTTLAPETRQLLDATTDYLQSLGDDITEQENKLYLAFKKIKNFACVQITNKAITLYLHLNPDDYTLEPGFTRDVRSIGHWGTGDLEVTITDWDSLEKAKPLIQESYRRG